MAIPKVATIIGDRLNALGLRWMASGSIASAAYGEYRTTNDIDLILVLPGTDVTRLRDAFPEAEFYCPPVEVIETEAKRDQAGHFNLIHHETAFKADVYIAGADTLHEWALSRRREVRINDVVLWLAPPEYVILRKLEFFREGRSEKHLRDIRGMLAMTEVDRAFLEKEIGQRGLGDVWRRCQ